MVLDLRKIVRIFFVRGEILYLHLLLDFPLWYSGGEGGPITQEQVRVQSVIVFSFSGVFGLAGFAGAFYESFSGDSGAREAGWGLGEDFVSLCRVLFTSVSLCRICLLYNLTLPTIYSV